MKTLTKRDLYCNHKWLDRLKRFSDDLITDNNTRIRIIVLTRHRGFRDEFHTSKTKFKKISAEHLNVTKNSSLIECIRTETMTMSQIDYQIMFVNDKLSALEMIKHMNIMIRKIVEKYYPTVLKYHWLYEFNKERRGPMIDLLTVCLSNAFNDEYMESQYGK